MALAEDLFRDLDRMVQMGARASDLLLDPGPWVVATYRVGRAVRELPRWAQVPLLLVHRPWEALLQTVTGAVLPANANIAGGLHLSHTTSVVVSPGARIGRDCELAQGTTIGVGGRGKDRGAPSIGDRVYIGPGAKVFGAIRIGNDAAIGANAVVREDVPDGAVVAGVPAKVVSTRGSDDFVVRGRRMPPLGDLLQSFFDRGAPALRQLTTRPVQSPPRASLPASPCAGRGAAGAAHC